MTLRRLSTRFLLAGAVLVVATAACGAWSVFTFAHLSQAVENTLQDSQRSLDLAATLASTLEREDDALLLAIAGSSDKARQQLSGQRSSFDLEFRRLLPLLTSPDEERTGRALHEHVEMYRAAGDDLIRAGASPIALERYHQSVNPILRRAVADCGRIRELNFQEMRAAGVRARDEARRATRVVAGVLIASLFVSVLVALYLARSVVRPVVSLTESVDAIRRGDFGRRVTVATHDELGLLADGYNRMAEALDDFRRSNLGEVLRVKSVLEATLEALPDAIIVVDPDRRVESMNSRARQILLRAPATAAPRSLAELPLPPTAVAAVETALSGVQTGDPHAELDRAFTVRLDNTDRKLLPIAVPIPELSEGRHGAIAVLHDVTEFVRLDDLRSEMVAVTSHELRTPLTTIRMNLLLLGEQLRNLTGAQQEILATAVFGCEELSDIIERLLDVARSEAGQLRLSLEPVDVSALAREVTARFRDRARETGVDLNVSEPAPRLIVNGDAARISIVLSNLLSNAIKYTPGGGHVDVLVSSSGDDGAGGIGAVQIAVGDTGPGIPEGMRERVFEKFFRVEHLDPGRSTGRKGAGLGLYLCRQIVDAHGGLIQVASGESGGTRVVVTLPRSHSSEGSTL